MGAAWRMGWLVGLVGLLAAGCGSAESASTRETPDLLVQAPDALASPSPSQTAPPAPLVVVDPSASPTAAPLSGAETPSPLAAVEPSLPVGFSLSLGFQSAPKVGLGVPAVAPAHSADADSSIKSEANGVASNSADTVDRRSLTRAAQNSPFHTFGDDVFTWNEDRQIVIKRVPAGDASLRAIREQLGHHHGTIEDTSGTRSWLETCARHYAADAIDAPVSVYGAVSAQGVHSCLGGLAHVAELFARYWWAQEGVSCVAHAVADQALHGDDRARPLAICPSVAYDPTKPQPPGWLAQRCSQLVAANPNPAYPSDPTGVFSVGASLPSCWEPLVEIIQTHAVERSEIGLADSPHDCFHAFLGYVWARQIGLESRSPTDLAIGCHYYAFEATP